MATATVKKVTRAKTPKSGRNASARVKLKGEKAPASGYDAFKEYNGQQYTGMKVGKSHKWYYDKGVWKETKVTPERWELSYAVTKRRAGHAPEGTGVPVGTAYHWFILSHQYVEKLNLDDYATSMVGLKFKLAHKRAGKRTWNASDSLQRKHLLDILKNLIVELEENPEKLIPIPLSFEFNKKLYEGIAIPIISSCEKGVCQQLDVTLNNKHLGVIRRKEKGWKMTDAPQALVNLIGDCLDGKK